MTCLSDGRDVLAHIRDMGIRGIRGTQGFRGFRGFRDVESLACPFIDLDEELEPATGADVPEQVTGQVGELILGNAFKFLRSGGVRIFILLL